MRPFGWVPGEGLTPAVGRTDCPVDDGQVSLVSGLARLTHLADVGRECFTETRLGLRTVFEPRHAVGAFDHQFGLTVEVAEPNIVDRGFCRRPGVEVLRYGTRERVYVSILGAPRIPAGRGDHVQPGDRGVRALYRRFNGDGQFPPRRLALQPILVKGSADFDREFPSIGTLRG